MSFWGCLNAPNDWFFYYVPFILTTPLLYNKSSYYAALSIAGTATPSKPAVGTAAFFNPRIQARKRFGPHNWDFIQIAVGLLLSDGHAEIHGNGIRITFQQEKTNLDYFMAVLKELYKLGYVSSMKSKSHTQQHVDTETGLIRVRTYYRLNTFTFASLYWLRDLFYDSSGNKIIRPELEFYLTPISLAHLISGDGSRAGYGVAIDVNCFSFDAPAL